jgi:hypothetical protein
LVDSVPWPVEFSVTVPKRVDPSSNFTVPVGVVVPSDALTRVVSEIAVP